MKVSANLGFLFKEQPFLQRIRVAATHGFDAVECHFPFEESADEVLLALQDCSLPMLSLNTIPGNRNEGEFGLAALKNRRKDAVAAIDQAMEYAARVKCRSVHVMAGKGVDLTDESVFMDNLDHAAARGKELSVDVLIEPMNTHDVPEYFLTSIEQGASIIERGGWDNVRIMFDCYHIARMKKDLLETFRSNIELIGHVQFSGVPLRNEPDKGEVKYRNLFEEFAEAGYQGYVGAEYRPGGKTEDSLQWMDWLRAN